VTRQLFSSPFFHQNTALLARQHYRALTSHLQTLERALAHSLEQVIPRGSLVHVIAPGPILTKHLPPIAREKRARVIVSQGNSHAFRELLSTEPHASADIHLIEPAGFTHGGALVEPHTTIPEGARLIGVGSALQWSNATPSTHDFASLDMFVTELGAYHHDHFMDAFTSWLSSLPPS